MMKYNSDLTDFKNLIQILPKPPLLTSQKANWHNFFLAYYQHPSAEILEHTIQHHVLEIIDSDSRSHHDRRIGNNNLSYQINGGEAFFCPADTKHWTSWEEKLNFTVVVFDASFFKQVADEIVNCDRLELAPKWKIFDPIIQTLVNALKADIEAGYPVGRLYGESFGLALATHLLKRFSTSKQKIAEYSGGLPRRKLKEVLDYIETNLVEDICLEALAQIAGISSFYFCRLFKQSMGVTPHQYTLQRRVALAKQLIKQTDLGIAEIALLSGFSHQSHLSRHFKRIVGVSPGQFRER